ncbi:MAG: response regulator, partial [Cyclobacteriaceae bacterium]
MNPEVLIVDDDEVIIYLHKRIISENKFHTAPKGFLSVEESLEYISSNMDNEKAYIVLLDINLPSMDGWDFLDYISEHQL